MALLWVDGFDAYGTTDDAAPSPAGILERNYSNAYTPGTHIKSGRLGGKSIAVYADSNDILTPNLGTTADTLIVGVALYFDQLPTGGLNTTLSLFDDSTTGMNVRWYNGNFYIYRGNTQLASVLTYTIPLQTWIYLEFKVKCHGSAGTWELKVGGTTYSTGTGQNTQEGTHAYHNKVDLRGFNPSGGTYYRMWFDDFYVADNSGAFNNDFLGNMRVVTLFPDAAGDTTQFTPDSGDNYARVNETVADDDTSYVESATSTDVDLYTYDDLTGITGNVRGVQVNVDCRETDASSYTVKTVCKSGTTQSADVGQSVGTTNYTTRHRILATDPNTAAQWSVNAVDAAQFGLEVG